MNVNTRRCATIFITGLSASGKSTLGAKLYDNLINNGITNVVLLDGEEVRKRLEKANKKFGYSTEDRNAYSMELANMALKHNQDGQICIICAISHVKETRLKVRNQIGAFMEVYLSCPVEVCANRDYKGNYQKAYNGLHDNFIGVTEPYQTSDHPELVLHTGEEGIDNCSEILLQQVIEFIQPRSMKNMTERFAVVQNSIN